ncbi:MAG: glycosyltransferase [Methylococcaceae bacterium]|nr:glycosyltransferase [Methylococcaceae bacterium]
MKLPRVSICIPTYCQIDFLRETLRSVKEQDFQDYELIIFDDTPDDSVAQLVASFAFDDRLYYQHNPTSLGSPANWNAAVRHAKGDYIKLLHHDDKFSCPEALGRFVQLLDEHPESDFAFSASSAQNITLSKNYQHCPNQAQVAKIIEVPETLFLSNIIGAPSATIYRNGLTIEYDSQLQWLVDIDFYIRILSINSHLIYTPEVLIDTTTDADHQITERCKNNVAIEMFEYLYVYQKIAPKISGDLNTQSVWFRLFEKYQIYALTDLKQQGIELPPSLEEMLLPFFIAYRQIWLKRTPYRIYTHLPESLKCAIRFLFTR